MDVCSGYIRSIPWLSGGYKTRSMTTVDCRRHLFYCAQELGPQAGAAEPIHNRLVYLEGLSL